MNRQLVIVTLLLATIAVAALPIYLYLNAQDPEQPAGGANRGQPQFVAAAGSPIAVGPMMQKLVASDLNRDGNPDIVVTCGSETQGNASETAGFVAILIGDGRGAFEVQPLIPMEYGGLKAAVGDLNNDKRGDIVVIAHDSYQVAILLQDERGRFTAESKSTVLASDGDQPHTHDVALADVDGDQNLDILTTNEDEGSVSVLLGDGNSRFTPARGSPFAAGRHPYEGLSVADLNGDRQLDVVVPNIRGNALSILLGNGNGGFAAAPGSPLPVGERPGFVALGNLDGDGIPDIVATHDDDPIVDVLQGNGSGGFQPFAGSPIHLAENVWGASVADVDGDGNNDLVLGGKQEQVLILLGDGAGGFDEHPVMVSVGGKAPGNIAVADVNRDGKLDLITSNYESGSVSVLIQQ